MPHTVLLALVALAVAAAPAAAQVTFSSGQSSTTVKQTWFGAMGDFNGDGHQDVALGGAYGTAQNGFVWLKNNVGSSGLTRRGLHDNGRSGHPYMTVGDFNGDGFDDIAASFPFSTTDTTNYAENVGLYMGTDETTAFPDESKARGLEGACAGRSIITADFDDDGDLDLFQVCKESSQNRMFHNDGTGYFSAATIPAFLADAGGDAVNFATVGDINDDGFVDIYLAGGVNVAPVFALNDGAGSFTDVSSSSFPGFTVPSGSYICRLYDFNGDGCTDALFMDSLHLNPCDGSDPPVFTNTGAWTEPNPGNARSLGVGDYDGDGDIDAYIPQGWNNLPSTILYDNDGSGSFDGTASPTGWLTGNKDLVEVMFIDLTNDGDLDVLTFERCNTGCGSGAERSVHYAFNLKNAPGTHAYIYMANDPLPAFQKPLPPVLTLTESETGATRVIATRTETSTYGVSAPARVLVQGLTPETEYTVVGSSAGIELTVTFTTPAAEPWSPPSTITLEVPPSPAGSDCDEDADCASGVCLGTGVCGAVNGESCDEDEDCISNTCLHDSDGNVCVGDTPNECAAGSAIDELLAVRINDVAYMVTTVEQDGRDPDHDIVGLGPVWVVDGIDTNTILCPDNEE